MKPPSRVRAKEKASMVFNNWLDAVAVLDEASGPSTPAQLELAKFYGMVIPEGMPTIVAAAMLRCKLATILRLSEPQPVSELAREWIGRLHQQSDPKVVASSEEEANAWIEYLRLRRRHEALSKLQIKAGDVVYSANTGTCEVSSIGRDGRVHFKGGMGSRAWPDLLTVVARAEDAAPDVRLKARNASARRRCATPWSVAKQMDLQEFSTNHRLIPSDIENLESVIDNAKDERPIQKYLQQNPHIMTALLTGRERYCLPQKRLGADYIPDFVIGDVDSLGYHWLLVELETPRSGVYIESGMQLDAVARKGVQQIMDWRDWLSGNIATARERRANNGLGLFDIREKTRALVLVGRRSLMPATKDSTRMEYRQSNNIEIHTYDWLLDTLWGILHFSGPPALNPLLIDLQD